jgi:transposase InsO family protein
VRDVVLFPDVAAVAATFLRDVLGVQTSNQPPNPRPDQFYVVRRVGGISRSVVMDDATVIVEAWALTDEEAADLAQLARAHLLAIAGDVIDGVTVWRVVDVGGPANLPDPTSGQSRMTATYQISARGSSLSAAS